jgi:uroporphyrinogen decarboxylase
MEVLQKGTPDQVRQAVRECLRAGGGQRHILNLNHGVDRSTPPANFQAYVDAAREGVRTR